MKEDYKEMLSKIESLEKRVLYLETHALCYDQSGNGNHLSAIIGAVNSGQNVVFDVNNTVQDPAESSCFVDNKCPYCGSHTSWFTNNSD